MHIYLHAPFFHNIHHIQSQDYRLLKLNELHGQIQVSLQGRRIHHIDDDIHAAVLNAFAGNLFLYGIGGKAVDARQVNDLDGTPFIAGLAFHPLHRNTGPVCHLKLSAGKGVKQRGLAAVGIAHKSNCNRRPVILMLL